MIKDPTFSVGREEMSDDVLFFRQMQDVDAAWMDIVGMLGKLITPPESMEIIVHALLHLKQARAKAGLPPLEEIAGGFRLILQ